MTDTSTCPCSLKASLLSTGSAKAAAICYNRGVTPCAASVEVHGVSLYSNPWMRLRTYPAWRGLETALEDLASLLNRTAPDGSGDTAQELADQIETVLSDPETPVGRRPLRRDWSPRSATEQPDTEFELDLTELALDVVDSPVFLESPHAVRHLGQWLVSGLPRQWQGRISSWTQHLRQVTRSSRRNTRSAPAEDRAPSSPPTGADLPAGWQPDFAVGGDGQLALVLQQEATPAELQAAHAELLVLLLMQYGLDAARLHLHLLAGPTSTIGHDQVGQVLGLRRRTAALIERSSKAVAHLQNIRLSVYRWHQDGETIEYEVTSGPLWDLQLSYFGQARLLEQGGTLTTRGEEWSIRIRPGAGVPAMVPAPAPGALCPPLADLNPLAACTAILLAFAGRAGATDVLVPHDLVTKAAGVDPQDTTGRHLKAAARAQAAWGWRAEPGENATRFTLEEDLPD